MAFGASIAVAYSWRQAFIVLGGVGVLAAFVVLSLVREPRRGGLDSTAKQTLAPGDAERPGFLATLAMFFSTPSLLLLSLACGATQIITYGAGNFSTLFLMREKGMTLQEVAVYFALLVGICMGGGIFLSGRVIDRFARVSRRAYGVIPALSLLAAAPLFLGFVFAPGWPTALLFLAGPTALNYFYLSTAVTFVQEEVRPDQRVLSGALLLLVMNLIGMGVGPTFVGMVSDLFRAGHPHNSLQLAFLSLMPFYGLAILLFLVLAAALKPATAAPAATMGAKT